MQISEAGLRDLKLISPQRHQDPRGWFAETFSKKTFESAGLPTDFVQDNQSHSVRGVLRGLHCQLRRPQGKLIRVIRGHVWDVAVDLRRASPDVGRWAAFELRPLSDTGELEMLWIPGGFAHGFLVLSETADVVYKVTQPYDPHSEQTIRWDDPEMSIPWPLERLGDVEPRISAKDAGGLLLRDAQLF